MIILTAINKVRTNLWIFRSIHKTIYFNFKFLPFKQAIKLPILLYKPHFDHLDGEICIKKNKIKRGMIILGKSCANIYSNNGIMLDIRGRIVFKGNCIIGNDSYISISEDGFLQCGDNLTATAALKLVCYDNINIGKDVLIGWQCLICDNDFHTTIDLKSNRYNPISAPIKIGNHVWIANGCSIMKGTHIASNTIVASHSLVNKDFSSTENALIAGTPAIIKKQDVNWIF